MMERLFENENIKKAMKHLEDKPEQSGIDGIKIGSLPEYWEINKNDIIEAVKSGNYRCGLIEEYQIVNKKGKKRWIARIGSVDRMLMRALHQVLEADLNKYLCYFSYAFRDNKGVSDAILQAKAFISEGRIFVGELDLNNYFDTIPHEKLMEKLAIVLEDDVLSLVRAFVKCNIVREGVISDKKIGVLQGSPISPLLANFFLNDTDKFMMGNNISFIRYADDIKIFATEEEIVAEQLTKVTDFIEGEGLIINRKKTRISNFKTVKILGYSFKSEGESILAERSEKIGYYSNSWTKHEIERTKSMYHILEDGILGTSGFAMLFENENKKIIIPPMMTDTINIYASVVFASGFFKFLNENRISMNIFDRYGRFVGSFNSAKDDKSSEIAVKQMKAFCNEKKRLYIAQRIELAAAHNMRANLKYYNERNKDKYIASCIKKITFKMKDFMLARSIENLLVVEAQIREIYYSCFNHILADEDFEFDKRTKNPPKSAINALISFGNTLIYQRIAVLIRKSALDIKIGFIHSPNRRKETLQLDLSEIFKPIIVDRVIFTLINKQVLNEELHFERVGDEAVFLNKEGKRIFINAFERKMQTELQVKGTKTTYEAMMKEEINKIVQYLDRNVTYKPYKYI